MKKVDFGQTITILANVGVIAGIVFLAFELRQNNELLGSQARSNLVAGRATYQEYVATNDGGIADIIMKVRQAELSPTERFRLNVHWSLVLNNWAAMFEEVDSGPLVEGDLPLGSWRTTLQANPDLRERLKDTRADYSADFLELIEENLLAEPTR